MKDVLWRRQEILDAVKGKAFQDENWAATGVCINTMELENGDIFFALNGASTDGHNYVKSALMNGAIAAVVSQKYAREAENNARLIGVKDTYEALCELGRAGRKRAQKLVAITGSVGKTTIKDMARGAFARAGKTHASIRSFNNHVGVPVTLARMPTDTKYAISEMGMDHKGELEYLSKLAQPDVVVVSEIGKSHMASFESFDDLVLAKAEIFLGCHAGSIAIIHRDGSEYPLLEKQARAAGIKTIITFGAHPESQVRLETWQETNQGLLITVNIDGRPYEAHIVSLGYHNAINAAAVFAIALVLGIDFDTVSLGLSTWEPLVGRGQTWNVTIEDKNNNHSEGDFLLIDESYNANPLSLKGALQNFTSIIERRKKNNACAGSYYVFLGDMLDLGQLEIDAHKDVLHMPGLLEADKIFTIGNRMRYLHDLIPEEKRGAHSDSIDGMVACAEQAVRPGDIVMVKGSNATGISSLVSALKRLGSH
jgi:UDP-N-acetylmuramoyl-tripeptide--D-alanyl-D-alanine ligase